MGAGDKEADERELDSPNANKRLLGLKRSATWAAQHELNEQTPYSLIAKEVDRMCVGECSIDDLVHSELPDDDFDEELHEFMTPAEKRALATEESKDVLNPKEARVLYNQLIFSSGFFTTTEDMPKRKRKKVNRDREKTLDWLMRETPSWCGGKEEYISETIGRMFDMVLQKKTPYIDSKLDLTISNYPDTMQSDIACKFAGDVLRNTYHSSQFTRNVYRCVERYIRNTGMNMFKKEYVLSLMKVKKLEVRTREHPARLRWKQVIGLAEEATDIFYTQDIGKNIVQTRRNLVNNLHHWFGDKKHYDRDDISRTILDYFSNKDDSLCEFVPLS
ncbi:hypothetical protein ACFL3V_04735 [Nanoarchaeota archaeon]